MLGEENPGRSQYNLADADVWSRAGIFYIMVGGWCGGSRATAGGDRLVRAYARSRLDDKCGHTSAGMAPGNVRRFELFLNRRSA